MYSEETESFSVQCDECATDFTHKSQYQALPGNHNFHCRISIWVEEACSYLVHMDCFILLLPTDTEVVLAFGGMRVTSHGYEVKSIKNL